MLNNQRLSHLLDSCSYLFLLANIILIPLLVSGHLVNYFIFPKQYLFVSLILLNLLFFLVKFIIFKRIQYIQSVLDKPLLLLLSVSLLATIFSLSPVSSFFGESADFSLSFVYLFFLCLFYFVLAQYLNSAERWRAVFDTIIGVGALTAVVFLFRIYGQVDFLSLFAQNIFNTIDQTNTAFGVWLVVVFLLSAGQLIKKNLSTIRLSFYLIVSLLTLISLLSLNFSMIWWLLLGGLFLLLLIGINFAKRIKTRWLSIIFVLFISIILFIALGQPNIFSSRLPFEQALSFKSSWSVTVNTLLSGPKKFLLGSGPGTFIYDFSQYRDAQFNYDPNAWNLRFNHPNNSALEILSENGTVFLFIWLMIIIFVFGQTIGNWLKLKQEHAGGDSVLLNWLESGNEMNFLDSLLIVVPWAVVSVGIFVLSYSLVLWWLWFLLLSLTITVLTLLRSETVKIKDLAISNTPEYGLVFSFALFTLIAVIIFSGIWIGRFYLGEVNYAQALKAGDYKQAQEKLLSALKFHSNSDLNHVALAQTYLLEAADLSKQEKPEVQKISSLLSQAVNEARRATELSPHSVAIWENLATMYENAAVLVPEARVWAIKSLESAKDLEPTNPILWWRLGNSYGVSGKWDDAKKFYEEAVNLKSDHLGASMGLATAYEQLKDANKAIEVYNNIFSVGQTDPEYLYNFGRVLYNRNHLDDRANAKKLWLAALEKQPNFSNALYSLGLLAEISKDKKQALEYYYRVKALNPSNADIAAKIKNLTSGK